MKARGVWTVPWTQEEWVWQISLIATTVTINVVTTIATVAHLLHDSLIRSEKNRGVLLRKLYVG
ncbi:hypothetical protein QOT17_015207 [Balamuthia mandrillaris]